MPSPRRSTYATVVALLLALTLLAGLIILAFPILYPPSSILHQPVLISAIGIPLQMEYRQVIAAGVIGLLLLALMGYSVGRRLRNWLIKRRESREAEIQPEALAMAYRHRLTAQLDQLKVMDVANPFDLETSYVPLRIREKPRLHFEGSKTAPSSLLAAPITGGETTSPQEALVQFRHLALLGEPGAGKTTLLRYLAFQAAQGKLEDLPDFPILISLGHFAAAAPKSSLLDFILEEIDPLYGSPALRPELAKGLRSYLEERLEEGSVLLLLDGLDETNNEQSVLDRPPSPQMGGLGETNTTYRRVVGQINVLTVRYPKISIVVTSRRAGWKGLLATSFHTMEVLGLEQDDIRRFIEDWFGRGSNRARELQRIVLQNPQGWTLATNPLLLSLMAFVFEQDGELPEGPTGLYERSLELLLEKWEALRGRRRASRFTAEHQRDLLGEAALHFHLRRLLYFSEYDLSRIIAIYLPAVGLPADRVSSVLKRISAQYGLLREQAPGWYSFPLMAWQEYLVAATISKREQIELVLEGIPDLLWEGTALFLAEMLEDATPLLEGMLNRKDDVFCSNLLLAGRCLTRKPRIKRAGLQTSIIERLQDLVEGEYHLPLRQWAIGVLTEIGTPSISVYFRSLTTAKKLDRTVHRWVTIALASLGDESTVADLVVLLSDQGIDFAVRANIAAALGDRSEFAVIPQFLALLSDEEVDCRVRMAVAETLEVLSACPEHGRRDEPEFTTVVPQLLRLLPNEKIDYRVRVKAAQVLGVLGDESITSQLLRLLRNEKIDYGVRMTVAETLGALGDKSIASRLLSILTKRKIDPDVRASVAAALGPLGDRSVVPQLLRLLPDEKIDPSIRWRIVDALGNLGAMDDEATVPKLLGFLANEEMDPSVRVTVAEAMGEMTATPRLPGPIPTGQEAAEALRFLGDRSKVPRFLALLSDRELDRPVRLKILETVGTLGDDRITAEGLAALLDDEEIGSEVYQTLFLVSQRAGVHVFAKEGGGYEIR